MSGNAKKPQVKSNMTTTKIISSCAFGAESAALDVAIKMGFQHGGNTTRKVGRYGAKVTSRFDLTEKPFESPLDGAKANIHEADGTLFFTRAEPDQDTQYLIDYATEQDHPFWHIDFEQTSRFRRLSKSTSGGPSTQ